MIETQYTRILIYAMQENNRNMSIMIVLDPIL